MPRIKEDLSTQEKIEIIKGAQKLLGPGGKNWIKGQWFAKKTEDFFPGAQRFVMEENGPGTDYSRPAWLQVPPSKADCWCLLGALEESAYRLNLSERRSKAKVLGAKTSIKKKVAEYLKVKAIFFAQSVDEFNDSTKTEWKDVRQVMTDRIKELEKGA